MKVFLMIIIFLFNTALIGQKSTLADILWEEAGGRLSNMDADEESRTRVVDEASEGYLQVYYEDQGCGCPIETTVAGYKEIDGGYTVLKTFWDGCGWRKTLSSNKNLNSILPEEFGLHTFLPKSKETEYQITSAVFYLEAEIPRKGTETQLNLSYIPFGIHMAPKDHILTYQYKQVSEHGGTNFMYSGALQSMFQKISHENTLECILERTIDDITPEDKKIVEKMYGEDKTYRGIDELAAQIHQLKTIYQISKDVEFKSVILGWNRDEARFYIKEKIKNDVPELSFLEFVQQLPFLMAVC